MTIHAGIDIGSRTIKLVLLENGRVLKTAVRDTTFDPIAVCRDLLSDVVYQAMDGTAPDPSTLSKELGDYVKTVKVITGEALFSDSYLEI